MGCQQSSELRDEYEGERNLNALRHGQGRMMYADGHEYEGAWYQGVMHGFGTKVWRYNHFHSHGSVIQKRATLTACLRKVENMASTKDLMVQSARTKLQEFKNLAYPNSILKGVCTFLAATTGNDAWIAVRSTIR